MASQSKKSSLLILAGIGLLLILAFISLFIGKFPLSLSALLSGDEFQLRVFYNLRLSRMLVGLVGGFALGLAGYVFQIVFHNPLAAPDIIGVSSGASAGAAAGILLFGTGLAVTASAFTGALAAVLLAVLLSLADSSGRKSTIVLAGIVVHSLAQTLLMFLKLTADPEHELASIEYWIMGSLNAITASSARLNLMIALVCGLILILLHRQLILLSADETEARMLGVNVIRMRLLLLLLATLMVASVVSLTGLISFIGLIAPHTARLLIHRSNRACMVLSGILGAFLLCLADILARSIAATELPVSLFTSLIGAPFLLTLLIRRGRNYA